MLVEFSPAGTRVTASPGSQPAAQTEGCLEHGYTVRDGRVHPPRSSDTAPESLELDYPPDGGVVSVVAWRGREMSVLADHAGGFPIYMAAGESSVFLSDDAWQAAAAAGLNRLDASACMDLLAYEFVLGPRTLVEGLSELEAGCLHKLSWQGGRLQVDKRRVWRYDRIERDWPGGWDQRVRECEAMLRETCRPLARSTAEGGGVVALNLSGGWDSRAILAMLAAEGCGNIRTCTYGEANFGGTRAALESARVAGADARFKEFSGGAHLPEDFGQLCAELPPVVRFNLGDGALMVSREFYDGIAAAACGHCGGATRALTLEPIRTAGELSDWLVRTRQSGVRPARLREVLQPEWRHLAEAPNDHAADICREAFIPDVWGTQRYWLEQMVRRDVCTEMRILERRAPMMFTPFLERRFWEFWASVPPGDLDRQKLYRAVLAEKIFAGNMEPMRRIPREGGGRIDYDSTLAGRVGEQARRWSRALLRRVSAPTAFRLMTADPTAAWWHSNAALRAWVRETVMGSAALNTLFEPAALEELCTTEPSRNFRMANIGIWNLLTIAGVHDRLPRLAPPPARG